MWLHQIWNRRRAYRRLAELLAEAKRRGAAAGAYDVADQFSSWAEAMTRPVVEIVYGPRVVAPEIVAARRQRIELELEQLPPAPTPERAAIAVSYPLVGVVLLSGALTGVALDATNVSLGAAHWAVVALVSIWLSAALHALPVGVRGTVRLVQALGVRRRASRLSRQIARLDRSEFRERHREALRDRLCREFIAQLEQTYDFYRLGARAARAVRVD